jgi:hypothetical protein
MASLEELRERKRQLAAEQQALDKEYAKAYEEELYTARAAVEKKIEEMTDEEKESILSKLEHTRSSCVEGFSQNGYSHYREHWDCPKCMMMEILNGEHCGRFDFKISVDIFEVIV